MLTVRASAACCGAAVFDMCCRAFYQDGRLESGVIVNQGRLQGVLLEIFPGLGMDRPATWCVSPRILPSLPQTQNLHRRFWQQRVWRGKAHRPPPLQFQLQSCHIRQHRLHPWPASIHRCLCRVLLLLRLRLLHFPGALFVSTRRAPACNIVCFLQRPCFVPGCVR
jgi:hypothetical protein